MATKITKIAPEYILTLGAKEYPMYAGVLQAAFSEGLEGIACEVVQIAAKENDWKAVVKATITMVVDGKTRTFTDIADASPKNCGAKTINALERMASTRAKGRALRDAINLGFTLAEELSEDEFKDAKNGSDQANGNGQPKPAATRTTGTGRVDCSKSNQAARPEPAPTRTPVQEAPPPPGEPPVDEEPEFEDPAAVGPPPQAPAPAANAAATNAALMPKFCSECKRPLTMGQRDTSVGAFGKPLCQQHMKEAAKTG